MLFAIGTKVRLIHTGDIGWVEKMLEHDLVSIRLADGECIPVLVESIERIESTEASSVKAKFIQGKQKVTHLPIEPLTSSQYTVLKPYGLQLAFDPVKKADGLPDYYRIFLINDTQHFFLYQLSLLLNKQETWKTRSKLGPRSMVEAGHLKYRELNDSPIINVENWRLLPDGKGTGRRLIKELKLKPALFFKKLTTAPYLNRQAYLYPLFSLKELTEKLPSVKDRPSKESLKSYTKREGQKKKQSWNNLQELPHEVWEMAAFDHQIDLHIEHLVPDVSKIPQNNILGVQLDHFETYMAQAIRLGVESVFIIHGVGEGKLRNAIAKRLESMHEVTSFKNEYHAKYGYGATEVFL